jgi:hypothetical protein
MNKNPQLLEVLIILNRKDLMDVDKVVEYIRSLQNPDGSFYGDLAGFFFYLQFKSFKNLNKN